MGNLTANTTWEDLVFENRNKAYGAYLLRYGYPYYLTISALFVIALFLSVMVGHRLLIKNHVQPTDGTVVAPVRPIEPIKPPAIEINQAAKRNIVSYSVPKITKDEVKPDEELPTQKEAIALDDSSIVDRPIDSEAQNLVEVIETPPPIEDEAKEIPTPPAPDLIKNPEFPGGMKECARWLSNHLEYPATAVRMGIEGRVVVEFTVDENGRISDATVVEGLHRLCDQEAIRLVKSMPAWTPGEKNGVKTAQKYTLPIRFILQ